MSIPRSIPSLPLCSRPWGAQAAGVAQGYVEGLLTSKALDYGIAESAMHGDNGNHWLIHIYMVDARAPSWAHSVQGGQTKRSPVPQPALP